MGNTKGRFDDKQETNVSSQSFAARLTESQIINDSNKDSQLFKEDFGSKNVMLGLEGFTTLYNYRF